VLQSQHPNKNTYIHTYIFV